MEFALRSASKLLMMSVVAGTACNNAVEPVQRLVNIVPTQSEYRRGDTVRVVVSNKTDQTISYTVCAAQLERQRDNDWIEMALEDPNGPACADVLTRLGAGESSGATPVVLRLASLALPQSLVPGLYRIVIPSLLGGSSNVALDIENRRSATFEIK